MSRPVEGGWMPGDTLRHHEGYSALEESSLQGCWICSYLKDAILRFYMSEYSWSLNEAVAYHLYRDTAVFRPLEPSLGEGNHFEIYTVNDDHDRRHIGFNYGRPTGIEDEESVYAHMNQHMSIHQVAFAITAANSEHPGVAGRSVGKQPDFNLCSHWISTCSQEHSACGQMSEHTLPTRVLDLSMDSSQDIKLMETKGRQGCYATLSHCWGSFRPLITDSSNYRTHQDKIPFSRLPQLFQDVVIATRRLGMRYLWIDCLCIVQDDRHDWELEVARMDRIFENSTLTIAALDAESSQDGILGARTEYSVPPVPFPDHTTTYNCNSELLLQSVSNSHTNLQKYNDAPLTKRAWVLQERLLSHRVLFFGKDRLSFECRSASFSEQYWFQRPGTSKRIQPDPREYIETSTYHLTTNTDPYDVWCEVVENYTICRLSHVDDTLPALAGLARRFGKQVEDQYLAGLWRQDLNRELSWTVDWPYRFPSKKPPSNTSRRRYIAPSWSWASQRRPVYLTKLGDYYEPAVYDWNIISVETEAAGQDRFGQIKSGRLIIHGRMIQFKCNDDPDDVILGRIRCNNMAEVTFIPDSVSVGHRCQNAHETWYCLLGFNFIAKQRNQGDDQWMGLALERCCDTGNTEMFRRVGVVGRRPTPDDTQDSEHTHWYPKSLEERFPEWEGVTRCQVVIV